MSEPTPNTDEAILFLRDYYRDTDAVLTSIIPDGLTTTHTFKLDRIETDARRFIEERQGVQNIYFQVNPANKRLTRKARKTDIHSLSALHVDIDPIPPPDGAHREVQQAHMTQERTRILDQIEAFEPKPSIIIDSGGGYQAFWVLAEPMLLENAEGIEEAERYNKELESIFEADHCFNVDRIMRLPGTINVPNRKKRSRGRRNTLARLIKMEKDSPYDLSIFAQAAAPKPTPSNNSEVNLELDNLPPVNLDAYPIDESYKQIIIYGEDPAKPDRYRSRSEAVFGVVIALIKGKCSDRQILSILLNRRFKISESIFEKPKPEKYAIRQINRAKSRQINNFHLTDLGNSKRLVFHYEKDLRYIPPFKNWLLWDGNHWVFDEDGKIFRIAKSTILDIYNQASCKQDDDLREKMISWGRKSENVTRIKAMVELAKTENFIPILPTDLDKNPWLLGLPNGVLNLKTFQLQISDREDYITKSTEPIFNPNADCLTWLKFLERIMGGNDNLIQFIQRAVGYSLTGSTKEQVLFLLYGIGANGKSVFQSTVSSLLGDYSIQASAETFMVKSNQQISNDLARLRGARFVATSEIEDGQRMAESLVKQMTGQDPIVARYLYKENFEYIPNYKIWIAANHKPKIRGDDYAIWRRIKLIPFSVTIPKAEQDPDLFSKLKNELPGILNWVLAGCKQWQEQGLNAPEEVEAATEEYREEMDIFGPWIKERCLVQEAASCLSGELYKDYKIWSEERFKFSISQQKWGRKMTGRGFEREYTPQVMYRGITLLPKDEF